MEKEQRDWNLRFIKGFFIGSGFVLPGVSGGALAAVFGIYERLIQFLAHLNRDFKDNLRFFLPVIFGGFFGLVSFSYVISFLFGSYQTIILWFFIGCIIGTLPQLWQEAGKKGRSSTDVLLLVVSFVLVLFFLWKGESLFTQLTPNLVTWLLAGGIIGLGIVIPGLSPSNFLVYMNLYQNMVDGFKTVDLNIIVPLGIGGLVCVLALSKVMAYLFEKFYSKLFHFILALVLASTVMIIPFDYQGFSLLSYVACFVLTLLGIALGWWMGNLEKKYK